MPQDSTSQSNLYSRIHLLAHESWEVDCRSLVLSFPFLLLSLTTNIQEFYNLLVVGYKMKEYRN